jgi:hypothetical protein
MLGVDIEAQRQNFFINNFLFLENGKFADMPLFPFQAHARDELLGTEYRKSHLRVSFRIMYKGCS